MPESALRFGLCCKFLNEPIRFRTATAAALCRLARPAQLHKLRELVAANASALLAAIEYCHRHRIGSFRINSQILPLKTHPGIGYELDDLPEATDLLVRFQRCGEAARQHQLRLTFHPDQFILLNSPRPEVIAASLRDLRYHAEMAELVGADVINIHGGGGYGDKPEALDRLQRELDNLPDAIRSRLTLENDDRIFMPADLLPVCRATGIPLVYDVHHHRCLPDGHNEEETTAEALATWNREPLLHISSPRAGWDGGDPRPHHDYIAPADFPVCWLDLNATIEVEAKAKELAVLTLMRELHSQRL